MKKIVGIILSILIIIGMQNIQINSVNGQSTLEENTIRDLDKINLLNQEMIYIFVNNSIYQSIFFED